MRRQQSADFGGTGVARTSLGTPAAMQEDLSGHSLGPIGDAITLLLDAGKAAGTIRLDVDARDVIQLIGFLSRTGGHESNERAGDVLGIILDGLRRSD